MNSYRLTSMEEPTDEMLAQIMREAADIYRKEEDELQKSIETKLRNLANSRQNIYLRQLYRRSRSQNLIPHDRRQDSKAIHHQYS